MATMKVVILDPYSSQPLKGVTVEAHDLSDGSFISTATTNDYGVAEFTLTVDASFHARTANTPPLYQPVVPRTPPGIMNVDYVVASDSSGTHTTLATAMAAAIAAGGNKTIWLCHSVTESDIDIGGMDSGADITIASHSKSSVVITANTNEDIFKQESTGGNGTGGLHFINIGFSIPSSNYAIYNVNTTSEIRGLKFDQCEFDLSTLGYIARQDGNDSLGQLSIEVRDCTGALKGFYDVAGASATYGPDRLRVYGCSLTLTALWDGGSTNADPDVTTIIADYLVITNGITFPSGSTNQTFANLYIVFAAASALFTTASSSTQIEDLSFQNITIRFSNASGTFCNLGANSVNNNSGLFIDGVFGYPAGGVGAGGTFITVDTDWLNVYIGDVFGKDFTTQYSGPLTNMDATHYHKLLRDADDDTKIQVEESADEDIIRFDIEGTERMTLDGTKLDLLNSTYLDANDIRLPTIGTPTYDDVEDLNTVYHSTGWISGGAASDAGGETINVTAGAGAFRASNSQTAQLRFGDWAASNGLAIDTDSIRYIGVQDGTPPVVVVRTTNNFNLNTDFPLSTVVNEGGTLHIQNAPWEIGDHANFMIQRVVGTAPIARDKAIGGLIFSETGTRNVVVSAGALWRGLTKFTIGALDTDPGGAADTFDTYSADGQKATGVAAWPNEQYDDGDATLQDMGASKWANLWWYIELDGELVMVYGTNQYTSAAKAGEEAAPSTLPNRLQVHGILAARFIFQKSAGTAEEILSAFDTPFSVLGVTDHVNLANVTSDQHHAQAHTIASHSDTTATGAELETLTDGSDADALHTHPAAVSEHTYVFVPDAAKGADITVADQQGILHHSGDQEETVTAVYLDAETAPTGASLIIVLEYGNTDDLDTVASWTTIDTVTLTATNKSVKDSTPTQATLPANRLIRMNVTQVGSSVTGKDAAVHMKVKRKLTS